MGWPVIPWPAGDYVDSRDGGKSEFGADNLFTFVSPCLQLNYVKLVLWFVPPLVYSNHGVSVQS